MVIKEYLSTREDGVKLYKSYSDAGYTIRKKGTAEEYSEAVDVEGAPFEYEETENKILTDEEILATSKE